MSELLHGEFLSLSEGKFKWSLIWKIINFDPCIEISTLWNFYYMIFRLIYLVFQSKTFPSPQTFYSNKVSFGNLIVVEENKKELSKYWWCKNSKVCFKIHLTRYSYGLFSITGVWILIFLEKNRMWNFHKCSVQLLCQINFLILASKFQHRDFSRRCFSDGFSRFSESNFFVTTGLFFWNDFCIRNFRVVKVNEKGKSNILIEPSKSWFCEISMMCFKIVSNRHLNQIFHIYRWIIDYFRKKLLWETSLL